jgi:hypothetical protein
MGSILNSRMANAVSPRTAMTRTPTVLKPQDVYVLLALSVRRGAPWTFAALARELGISPSELHAAVERAELSHLLDRSTRRPHVRNLLEFIEHGIRYAFPASPGPLDRGVPTAFSAAPLDGLLAGAGGPALVWPYADGNTTGVAISPLYSSVPAAALRVPVLYERLALVDAIRIGRPREVAVAVEALRARMTET